MCAKKASEPSEDTIRVEIGAIGSEVKTVVLNDERTIEAALEAANFSPDLEVRVNGNTYSRKDEVENGDSLIVINQEKVKGAK